MIPGERVKDGYWLAINGWVAEHCAEQPEEPEPLFQVVPSANAETVARIHNDLRARLAAVIGECDLADSRGHVTQFSRRVRRAAEGPGQ